MVSLESGLGTVIEPAVLVEDCVDGRIMLDESQALMSVEVTSGQIRLAALDMNKIGHLSALREHRGLRRVCDYLLVSSIGGTCHAVLIELKKTLRPGDDYRDQLRRSLPIVKYLVSVVEVEYEQWFGGLEVSYVSIFERISDRFDKHHVRVPEHGLIESEVWKSIQIKKFLGSRLHFEDLVSVVVPDPIV